MFLLSVLIQNALSFDLNIWSLDNDSKSFVITYVYPGNIHQVKMLASWEHSRMKTKQKKNTS